MVCLSGGDMRKTGGYDTVEVYIHDNTSEQCY